ncbi:MAG: GNAT family N-acetyltransferase [Anaerolineae bacterium]|nr:GNAT family N-acetyltransferase [Anaerolineae bacterium]RIK23487.1 MAG: hypothetical protein DCC51_03450 [Anaerolineae bacterium]
MNPFTGSLQVERELELPQWRAFVDANPDGNIFHTPEMFEVFSQAARHRPTCWAVVDESSCPLALLTPVEVSVLARPFHPLSSRAVAYGGVLCEPSARGRQALTTLMQAYSRHPHATAIFTELRNQTDVADLQPILESAGYHYEGHLNYLIDLTQSEETLWRRINRSGRQGIRAAEIKGVTVIEGTSEDHVDEGYEVLRGIYARTRVPLADRSLFMAAFRLLTPRGMLKLLLARYEGRTIGAVFDLHYKDRIFGWYGGADRTFHGLAANELLIWHIIRRGQEQGMVTFDFGGAGKPGVPYGPRDFKAKFGGELVNYGRNTCVHAPWRLRIAEAGYELRRRLA